MVGEMAIIPAREARERVYALYRDKWVDYVEVSKRTDYNPSSRCHTIHTHTRPPTITIITLPLSLLKHRLV